MQTPPAERSGTADGGFVGLQEMGDYVFAEQADAVHDLAVG